MHSDTSIISQVDAQLVRIPAGEITLRDDRTKQQWTVAIPPFLLARFPMTQALYRDVMGASPSTFIGDQRPVETVSWVDAITFCNALSAQAGLSACYAFTPDSDEIVFHPKADGYRLPTEAEWEYACKAGTTGVRYCELDEIAWYRGNSQQSTQAVGQKAPNPWGLYDMLGNVWEWCSDIYDATVYGSYRIIRGGGWSDEARGCMATNRRRSHPRAFRIEDLGFRVGRNASLE